MGFSWIMERIVDIADRYSNGPSVDSHDRERILASTAPRTCKKSWPNFINTMG